MSGSRPVKEFDRVNMNITYFIPSEEACKAWERGESFRPPAVQVQHTGLLQEFHHQIDDSRDQDLEALEKLRSSSNGFNSLVQDMTAETRLRLYFSDPAADPSHRDVSLGLRNPWQDVERRIILPDDPELALKAIIPYQKVREFINFWDKNIVGPLHSLAYKGVPLLSKGDIRILKQEYSLN